MPLSQEHVQIRAQTRRFADEVIRPIAAELDRTERFPAEFYGEMARLGLFGISVAEADGGAGADCLAYASVRRARSGRASRAMGARAGHLRRVVPGD